MGLFSISVSTTTYFIEHKESLYIALINDNRHIKTNDYMFPFIGCGTEMNGYLCKKIFLFMIDWGRG